ncbi:unnamed protein product [Rhizophagus irregularis]|nr:unnamed protein product [Rhizophagus irregularis]CAB5380469.1 unnamed protein product [Rhizophagus irregularis]
MCQRKENIKKIQSVSNIRSTNEANEIVEDAILITDGMFTERKEEMAYIPIETELTPNEKKRDFDQYT